ncbi:RICIN domain-containing protein [Lentzea sp. NEAU-D7]|uniref:RICIN domain-containing protein n=1 Tax=Lentzea sp. NEAU-D7 TaxID=2994667 RepID=UPI00224B46A6|nr:RICIN domain-containing protein [Lentzea sp. NEAU-D7]MCX2953424.1 RICIN domain-containing protein [Lentzea sp. NEAU-D7]
MTDAVDGSANTTHGDISGTVVQAHSVGSVVVGEQRKAPSRLGRAAIVIGVVVALAVAVVVAVHLKKAGGQQASANAPVSTPPLLSTATTTAEGSSPATATSAVTAGPVPTGDRRTVKPVPVPTTLVPPPPPPPPGPTKPATDGPGYLVPAGNDQRAADFYENSWNDVVMWERHPPGDDTSFQPFWAREFSDSNHAVFRIRNQRGNLCMEPVFQENFGEHIKANACSWSNDAQLWQVVNASQLAHVASGRCLGTANDGSYDNGTWLIVSLCTGRADQKWRIAR